jgi:SdpI/YfhL protein family
MDVDEFTAYAGLGLHVVIWLCFGLVTVVGSKPGATRNTWAGIRIPPLMKSDEAWVAGHKAAVHHVRLGMLSLLPPAVIVIFFVGSTTQFIGWLEWALAAAGLVWILAATRSAAHAAGLVNV